MQAKGPPKKIMRGYQWVYSAPENGLVFFNYRKGTGKNETKELLKDYKGVIQCDGYSVFDNIVESCEGIELIGCLAHACRYFEKAK
jgi:hypothetical protein